MPKIVGLVVDVSVVDEVVVVVVGAVELVDDVVVAVGAKRRAVLKRFETRIDANILANILILPFTFSITASPLPNFIGATFSLLGISPIGLNVFGSVEEITIGFDKGDSGSGGAGLD